MTWLDRILRWNPLAGRYAFIQLRPRNLLISGGMYLCTLIILFIVTFLGQGNRTIDVQKAVRVLFGMLMSLQVFMLWIAGLYNSGSIVREEKQDKSIDFFRLLPVSPHARIVGVLVGRNLALLLLGIINGVLAALLGLIAKISVVTLLEIGALVAAGAAALMLISLLSSMIEIKQRTQSGPIGLLVLCVFVLPYLFAAANLWSEVFPEGAHGTFFGCEIRLLSLITAVILYFGAWIYAGLVRRFRYEREPMFTPYGAISFMAGFILLVMGLFWSALLPDAPGVYLTMWILLALPLLLLPGASSHPYEDYAETIAAGSAGPCLFPPRGNLVSGLTNLALWLVMALLAHPPGPALAAWSAVGLATFWLVLLLTSEATIVCTPLTPRIKHLAIFLVGLYLVLPPLLGGMLNAMELAWFSPAGYLVMLAGWALECSTMEFPAIAAYVVPPANLVLAFLLTRLIHRRYRTLK